MKPSSVTQVTTCDSKSIFPSGPPADSLYSLVRSELPNANDTRTRNRYRNSKTRTRKPVPVFCRCVTQIGIDFFRYRNLVQSRTVVFYSVQETVTKMTNHDSQTIASCVVCLYKLCCLLFYCFKMNWGDSSVEKLIQKFCFQFHLVRKTGTRKLVPVFW